MKRLLRRVRDGLAALGAAKRLRDVPGPALLVLTYHRVLPRHHTDWGREQPGMLVTPESLGMHLEEFGRHGQWTHLDDWLAERDAGRPLPRLACAVTFDDGWRDNFDHALPVLQRHAVPATVFLVTAMVGTRYAFWPNRLARALLGLEDPGVVATWPAPLATRLQGAGVTQRARLTSTDVDRAIEACKAVPDTEIQAALDAVPEPGIAADGERDLLDWSEIAAMRRTGLVRFGSHTRRHTRLLAGLDAATLRDEVEGSARDLADRLGEPPALFCYPNGDRCPAAERLVAGCYRGAVTTEGGWNDVRTPALQLRRVGVHEDVTSSPAGLLRRVLLARRAS